MLAPILNEVMQCGTILHLLSWTERCAIDLDCDMDLFQLVSHFAHRLLQFISSGLIKLMLLCEFKSCFDNLYTFGKTLNQPFFLSLPALN